MAVLRKRRPARTIPDHRFEAAVGDLTRLDVERVPTLRLMRRAYELHADVTAYDATYVAFTEALECELLTADRRLSGAGGPWCAIRVLS